MYLSKISFLTCYLVLFSGLTVMATEYHVSVSGQKENPGTKSKPFKTISEAAAIAQPGDIITTTFCYHLLLCVTFRRGEPMCITFLSESSSLKPTTGWCHFTGSIQPKWEVTVTLREVMTGITTIFL